MSEKRRDHRGRILHNGEIQLSDGRYRFKYVDEMGKERCVYSWRLDHNDATPKGKRRTLSLREMEKKIQADHFEQIATNGGNMTVLKLVEKYTSTKTGVRPTTVAGYGTVINLLKKDPFGKRRIDTVRISDAKCWLIHLQQVEKKSYSSIHSIRGVLRPAFQLAVDDDLIRKNPFQFQLMEVVVNDSVTREAISRAEERKFLRFVKEDSHFCRYYEGIYILFKTGLRISEFCGLTISDIDFKEHTINIDHQLQKKSKIGYYIQETKTTSGTRKMSKNISRLEKYVNAMTNLYRLEDIDIPRQQITFHSLIDNFNNTAEALCYDKHFSITTSGNNITLFINLDTVMQIYENLLSNSIRYAKSDIAISVVIENDNLVISVSDDGCGFKNIDIEKATLPFYKSSKDIATEHLGLGLNISKILSERHGGNIQIANNKAGGACVTVKINCNES